MATCICKAQWSGEKTSHCGTCHHTFTTVSNFDRHQRNHTCNDPVAVGLVCNKAGRWHMPGGDYER